MANFYANYAASPNGGGITATTVDTIGTIDSTTPSANGAVIVGHNLIMQSASATVPGLVNNSAQTMSGAKLFSTSVETPQLLLKGSVSGDLTHTVPSAVTPYSLSWPAAQAGGATFLKNDGSGGLSWASGTGASGVDSIGTIDSQSKSADGAVISGTTIYFQTADATEPGMVSNGAQTLGSGTKTVDNLIDSGLTINTAVTANGSKQLVSSSTTDTELGYVHGVTSAIQTQLNSKQATLTIGDLTDAGTDGITIGSGTGAVIGSGTSISQHVADVSHNGYLSSTDWSTFNGKQAALTIGDLTDVGTDGIVVTGGVGSVIGTGTSLAQHVADTTHNGYLSSTDWNTFNGKQASGNYITALTGDVTASGPGSVASTLATVNSNVGAFTNANITVNAKGLITAAASGSSGGGGYTNSATINSNTVMVTANRYFVDTSGGVVTMTMPTGPSNGDYVEIVDIGGAASTNAITVARASQSIQGLASNYLLESNFGAWAFSFKTTSGWYLV